MLHLGQVRLACLMTRIPLQSQQDSDSSKRARSDAFHATLPAWQGGGDPRKQLGTRVLLQALIYTKQAVPDAIWQPFQVGCLFERRNRPWERCRLGQRPLFTVLRRPEVTPEARMSSQAYLS